MKRDIYNSFVDSKGDIHHYTQKENKYRRQVYRDAINKCCWPGCPSGFNLNVHHIVPIKSGGTDDYNNFIVLCAYCHGSKRLHRTHIKKRLELLTYKFYIEYLELGFCSDNMSNEEFQLKCSGVIHEKRFPDKKSIK